MLVSPWPCHAEVDVTIIEDPVPATYWLSFSDLVQTVFKLNAVGSWLRPCLGAESRVVLTCHWKQCRFQFSQGAGKPSHMRVAGKWQCQHLAPFLLGSGFPSSLASRLCCPATPGRVKC